MNIFRRTPDATVTVTAGRSETAYEAMVRHRMFVNLVMKHRLDLVATNGPNLTLRGRPKRIAAFTAEYALKKQSNA